MTGETTEATAALNKILENAQVQQQQTVQYSKVKIYCRAF